MTGYLTIARDAVAEIEERRSRFRCQVARVEDEEGARAVVEAARRAHHDARHHCSAYVLGPTGALTRAHDDGEPSGTAGAPMLAVLQGAGVSDTVAVVTRWFGGVLLGTGGLARAYADAVRAGLEAAGSRERRLLREFVVTAPHADAGRLETELRQRDVVVLGVEHAAAVTLRLGVGAGHDADFAALVRALTAGACAPESAGEHWVDLPG